MIATNVLKKLFGSRNERLIKAYRRQVEQINALESTHQGLSDAALRARTDEFRKRLTKGETLIDLLPEAFASVREAARRTLNMRHFDVQLIGGMVLHDGKIAEMRTGEGKTLVATLAAYLNALSGQGVHIVTVNDYLARRDAEWMGKIYDFLGLSVGVIVSGLDFPARQTAYSADITYGTNNEFGFDYLRDNMAFAPAGRVQRGLNFAIVDEVDSILIDEARTPLIISGPSSESSELYVAINKLIPRLTRQLEEDGPGDYSVDEKARQVHLTEEGHQHVEALLTEAGLIKPEENLYDVANIGLMHHLNAALRANALFQKNVEYIVRDHQVIIVDEFTGRTMPGRRWSEGLHQAIEAKEGVPIQRENQTLASITFQNYFRLYNKLSGMTGTADTEAYEFQQIYALEVVVIPTHKAMVREDLGDVVYLTMQEKFQAIIEDIKARIVKDQPVLVGTASIETSEQLSNLLNQEKIKHQVLNAKFHEAESQIIAQAGRPGTITIATNMAGRGTDIVLGGSLAAELAAANEDQYAAIQGDWQNRHEQVVTAGGLHIIGTERHDSRRVDNQLRGRSGRQGDPGSSRFYLSLEDNLMRIFASGRVKGLMQKLGMQAGEAIEHPWVTKAIENAQRKVEAHNFDIRKHLLEYDDVANDQRKVIYTQRAELMEAEDIAESIQAIRQDVLNALIMTYIPPNSLEEQWNVEGLQEALAREFGVPVDLKRWLAEDESLHEESLRERIQAVIARHFEEKEQAIGAPTMRRLEKDLMLQVLDHHWKEHLAAMDYLRQGIGLRGYAQKNPKQEYKREAFEMFQALLERMKHDVITVLAKIQVSQQPQALEAVAGQGPEPEQLHYEHADAGSPTRPEEAHPEPEATAQTYRREGRKIGRNEPCGCGSGKKFKHCHGQLT